jgi:hypothetical protein
MADSGKAEGEEGKDVEGVGEQVKEEKRVELPPAEPPPKVVLSEELLRQCVSQIGKTFDGLSYAYTKLAAEVGATRARLGQRNRAAGRRSSVVCTSQECVPR